MDNGDHGTLQLDRKTRFLSTIMDLARVESIKTIETTEQNCKIFVETTNTRQDQVMNANNDGKPTKRKRRKITIISNKKHRDGSIETVRQDIYKNYGHDYAKNYERKLNKTLMDISLNDAKGSDYKKPGVRSKDNLIFENSGKGG